MFNHQNHPRRRRIRMFFPLFIAGAFFAISAIVMLLWNELLPNILHTATITYWQAAGLLLLSRILVGGMPFGRGRHGGGFRGGPPSHLREKLMNMSDEERTQFKEQWKERCRDMRGRR